METLQTIWEQNPSYFFLAGFILLIGAIAKLKLFAKCDQPIIAAIIPIYDLMIVMRIIGRPDAHVFLLLIPGYNIYFLGKLFVEMARCFGKYNMLDYVLAVVLAPFYFLNLALAYNEVYYGPVYGMNKEAMMARKQPQLA